MANRRGMVTGAKLERIGEAIREKTGRYKDYKLDEMPDAIMSIGGGGSGDGTIFIPEHVLGDGSVRNGLVMNIIVQD